MSKKKTSTKTNHETATFRFLPFAVDLFERRDLKMQRSELLPVRAPQELTAETLDVLGHVVRQGTLAFLCREGGWRAIAWAREGKDAPERDVRLTDERVWRDFSLRFGDESVDTLLMVYNAVCRAAGQARSSSAKKRKDQYPTNRHMSFERNGDILVHHIAYLKTKPPRSPFPLEREDQHFLDENPLTRLTRLDASGKNTAQKAWERLLEPDMQPFLPWLGHHISRRWLAEMELCWTSDSEFTRITQGMATYFEAVVETSIILERRDLLIPLLDFFLKYLGEEGVEETWMVSFNRLFRDLRFADREPRQRTWARGVRCAVTLAEQYGEARGIHPIDRTASDRVYMEAYEAHQFQERAERARVLANRLESVIT